MSDYQDWLTLREIDQQASLPKGSAFRCFKRQIPSLTEGLDFIVLDHQRCSALAAQLHAADRLYRSSIHPVLLAPPLATLLLAQLRSAARSGN